MRNVLLAAATLLALSAATGCAAVFKGSKQDVRIVAIPEGSDVRLDNQFVGESPVEAKVDRNASQQIVVSKQGFGDERVRVQRHPDAAWWIWDIATCAIPVMLCIPLAVDALTGAWFSLDDEVRVKLDPSPARPSPSPSPSPAEDAASPMDF